MMTDNETKTLHRGWRSLIFVGLIVCIALALWQVTQAAPGSNPPYNHGRFGFGVTRTNKGEPSDYDIASLNAGWYWDWAARGETEIPSMEYMQTVRLKPVKSGDVQIGYTASPTGTALRNAVLAQPGATWLIGNEPDCSTMDNMISAWYARAYHDMYTLIKSIDPTAKVGAGSIVQPTQQRLMYLDRVLSTYQREYGEALPADLWVTHSYILCEKCYPFKLPGEPFAWGACWVPDWPSYGDSYDIATAYTVEDHYDIEIFKERLIVMRQWMYDNGYRDHPLIISEYGILFYDGLVAGKTDQDTIDFMVDGFDWMLSATHSTLGYAWDNNRIIQKWAWFSLDHDDWYLGGTLFDPFSKQRTPVGTAFANYTTESTVPVVDLAWVDFEMQVPVHPSGTSFQVTTSFTLANVGDIMMAPVTITVYENQTPPTPITTTVLNALQCCGDHEALTLTWTKYTAAAEEFCIDVSAPQIATETQCRSFDADVRLDDVWVIPTLTQTQQSTGTIYAKVTNYGTIETLEPVTLTFYALNPEGTMLHTATATRTLIGQVTVPPLACCGDTGTVTVTWPEYERGRVIALDMETGYAEPVSVTVPVNSELTLERVWAPSIFTIMGVPSVGTLRALVVNEGALDTGSPVTVSFYMPESTIIPIGETIVPALACCGDQAEAAFRWDTLPDRNIIDFCAIASTPYDVSEPKCGQLFVDLSLLYLPFVSRN